MKKLLSILMLLVAIVTGAKAADLVVSNTTAVSETFADGSILYSIDSDGRVNSSTKFGSDKDIVEGGTKTKGAALVDKRFAIKFPVAVTSVTIYGYNSSSGRTLSKVSTSTTMEKNSYTEITTTKNSSSAAPNYNYTFTASWTNAIAANTAIWFEFNNSCNFYKISYTGAAPAQTYTVTYKANNGTEEADVVDEAASTFAACSGTWTVPEGKGFTGWNTAADGTGDPYAVGAAVTGNTTVFAQWADIYTQFSMTSITGPTDAVAAQTKADVTATFSAGASAEVFNGHGSNDATFVDGNGVMNMNSSGGSYLHITLPSPLQAGDIITLGNMTGACKVGKTTSSSGASTKEFPYTLTTSDALIGVTDVYFFKDGSLTFNSLTITGAKQASNLSVISSTTPIVAIDATSDIEISTSSTGDITYESSNNSVATVTDAGVITGVGGGTATITINQAADDDYRAGVKTVTVTVPETAIIKVKLNGTSDPTVTGNISGVSAEKSGIESGNKFGSGAYVTLTLPTGYTFQAGDILNVNISGNATGSGFIGVYNPADKSDAGVWYNTGTRGTVGDNKFVLPAALEGKSSFSICRAGTNGWNAKVAYISVTRPNAVITLNASGFATYSSAYDFEYLGADAYGMKLTETSLSGTKVTAGKIKAGEGILFKGEANAKVSITETTGAEDLENNSLVGTTPATGDAPTPDYANHKYFVLKGNQFVPYQTASTFAANKAYFEVDEDFAPNSLDITFDDAPTAVEAVAEAKVNVNVPVKVIKNGQLFIGNYNVAGQRVQ